MEEELQMLYQEYMNLGLSRNMALVHMRQSEAFKGYSDEDYKAATDYMKQLYASGIPNAAVPKKKSQGASELVPVLETGSMGSTSGQAADQQAPFGSSVSKLADQIRDDGGVELTTGVRDENFEFIPFYVTGDKQYIDATKFYGFEPGEATWMTSTNYNLPEFVFPGSPSSNVDDVRKQFAISRTLTGTEEVVGYDPNNPQRAQGFLRSDDGKIIPVAGKVGMEPGRPEAELGVADVPSLNIQINVQGFMNGNSDPDFPELLALSQASYFDVWAKEKFEEEGDFFRTSKEAFSSDPNLAFNMGEVINDMAYERVFGSEGAKRINDGESVNKLIREKAKMIKRINDDMIEGKNEVAIEIAKDLYALPDWAIVDGILSLALRTSSVNEKYWDLNTLRREKFEVRNEINEEIKKLSQDFTEKYSPVLLSQITNEPFRERTKKGELTEYAKSNLANLERQLNREYGVRVDLNTDRIIGEDQGSLHDFVTSVKIGGHGAALSANYLIDAGLEFLLGTDYSLEDRKAMERLIERSDKSRRELRAEVTQYMDEFRDVVKRGDAGTAVSMMVSNAAEGWPIIGTLLLTRRLSPMSSAAVTSGVATGLEAAEIRDDYTFDDFVDEDGNKYTYYEAVEKAGSTDINELKSKFTIEKNNLNRAGYLSSKAMINFGQAYVSTTLLRNFTIPEGESFIRGYASYMGIAMSNDAVARLGAEVFGEMSRDYWTGDDIDFFAALEDGIWNTIESSGTSFALYSMGYGGAASRGRKGTASRSNTLARIINEDPDITSTIRNDIEVATRMLQKKSGSRNKVNMAEAASILSGAIHREGIMYRQNQSWLDFLVKQDIENNTNLFGGTVDLLNNIEKYRREYRLTNDPGIKQNLEVQTAYALSWLQETWKNNKDDFYKSKDVGGGVIEQEMQASIVGETPASLFSQMASDLRASESKPKPQMRPTTNIDDIVDLKTRSIAEESTRKDPQWLVKNIDESQPASIDRARLEEILNSEDFAIVTGEFPQLQSVGSAENEQAMTAAKQWLESNGISFHEVSGRSNGKGKRSFLVESMTDTQMMEFLDLFGQHSAMRSKGLVKKNGDYQSMEDAEWVIEEGVTEKTDNTSAMKLSDGTVVTFSKEGGKFVRGDGSEGELSSDDFWGALPEDKVKSSAPPADVPEEVKGDGFRFNGHALRNLGARALDFAFAIRLGKYKNAEGKTVKVNDLAVIESYKSLQRERAAVADVTRGDMVTYSAVRSMAQKKGLSDEMFAKINRGEIGLNDPVLNEFNFTSDELAAMKGLRENIDSLSDRLIYLLESRPVSKDENGNITAEGQAHLDLIETIKANKGSYLTTSYKIFTDGGDRLSKLLDMSNPKKRKKVPKEIRQAYDNAVRDIASRMDAEELIKNPGAAEEQLKDYLLSIDGTRSNYGDVTILGSINNGLLKTKNNQIPESFRNLLGEIDDPTYQYFATISKLRAYVTNYEWQMSLAMSLRQSGLGEYNVSSKIETPLGKYVQAHPGAAPSDPLYGMMIPEDLRAAFSTLDPIKPWAELLLPGEKEGTIFGSARPVVKKGVGGFMDLWTSASAIGKLDATVMAPASTMRNLVSGNFIQMGAGHWWATNPEYMHDAMRMAWSTDKRLGKARSKVDRKAYMSEREKLVRGGVLAESVSGMELMRTMQDFVMSDYRKGFDQNGGAIGKARDTMIKMYSFGDEFFKVMGYYQERDMLIKSGELVEDAEMMAMQRIKDMYPTYSNISYGARLLRKTPFMAPFPSFPYEVVRNSKNVFYYMIEDLKSGNEERRKSAYRKAAGQFGLGGLATFLTAWTAMSLGLDDEDVEALKVLQPEYQRNQNLIWLGKDEEGEMEWLNLSYTLPQEVFFEPLRVLFGSDPTDESYADQVMGALNKALEPYTASDIFTEMVVEIANNEDENGNPIYDTYKGVDGEPKSFWEMQEEDSDVWLDVLQHAFDSYAPGFARQNMVSFLRAEEMVDKDNPWYELQSEFRKRYPQRTKTREYTTKDAVFQMFGISMGKTNSPTSAEFHFRDIKTSINSRGREHENFFLNDQVEVTPERAKNRATTFLNQTSGLIEESQKLVEALKKLYLDVDNQLEVEEKIIGILMRSGFSAGDAYLIYNGDMPILPGISEQAVGSRLENIYNNPSLDEEEKEERESILLKNVELYNNYILEFNEQNFGEKIKQKDEE